MCDECNDYHEGMKGIMAYMPTDDPELMAREDLFQEASGDGFHFPCGECKHNNNDDYCKACRHYYA